MPHWLLKSAIHRVISLLPASQRKNEFLQTHFTNSLNLSAGQFEAGLSNCRRHLEHFFDLRPRIKDGFSALEIGTGWHPILPIGMYLCGAADVWTFDIAPLLRRSRLKLLLRMFCDYNERGDLQKFLPRLLPVRAAALRRVLEQTENRSPDVVLEQLRIHAVVGDARNTRLKVGSIDLFFSQTVLEYIPRTVLCEMFGEFARLCSTNAVMSHYVDLFDQFALFDRTITRLNFLKYSNRQWRFLRSPMTPLNRLRLSDYCSLLAETGFQIRRAINTSASEEDLGKIRLAPEFMSYSKDDLLVLTSWIVAEMNSDVT